MVWQLLSVKGGDARPLNAFNNAADVQQLQELHRFYDLKKIIERMNGVANNRRREFLECITWELQQWLGNGVSGIGGGVQHHHPNNPQYNYPESLGLADRVTTEATPFGSAACSYGAVRNLEFPNSRASNLVAAARNACHATDIYTVAVGHEHDDTMGSAAGTYRYTQDALSEMLEWTAPNKTCVIHRKISAAYVDCRRDLCPWKNVFAEDDVPVFEDLNHYLIPLAKLEESFLSVERVYYRDLFRTWEWVARAWRNDHVRGAAPQGIGHEDGPEGGGP